METKKCKKCGENRYLTEYSKRSRCRDNLDTVCRKCRASLYKNNKVMHSCSRLKHLYGITLDDKLRMIEDQNNVCAICKKEIDISGNVDHDHTTGKVRGILCNSCNRALGYFKDNTENLKQATLYLESYQ